MARRRQGAPLTDAAGTTGYAHYDVGRRYLEMCPSEQPGKCDRRDVLHRWWVPPARLAVLRARHPATLSIPEGKLH